MVKGYRPGAALGAVSLWVVAAWSLLLHGLTSFGLMGPDEPRYAEVAWEMLQRGDWLTPRLWGAPWFEKPVLFYWLAALADRVTGNAELGARLPNALLALLLAVALFAWLRHARGLRAGALAAVLAVSAAGMIGFARAASTDMTLTATLAGALIAFHLWSESGRAAWRLAGAACLALATLAKGPVAVVLAALVWLGFAFWRRQRRCLAGLLHPAALALYFALAAPWYGLVAIRNPGFFRTFFLQHNLERFATNLYQHPQPFWYYLAVLPALLFPWTGWLALVRAPRGDRLKQYLWLWVLAPLAFFTLSRSKLPGYALPALPGAVALLAVTVAERWDRMPRWAWALVAAPAAIVPVGVWLLPWFLAARQDRPPLAGLPAGRGAALWFVATLLALALLVVRRSGTALLVAVAGLAAAGVWTVTRPPFSRVLDVYATARPMAGLTRRYAPLPLYAWQLNRNTRYGVQFYLHRPLPEWRGGRGPAAVLVDDGQAGPFATLYGAPLREWDLQRASLLILGPGGQAVELYWRQLPGPPEVVAGSR